MSSALRSAVLARRPLNVERDSDRILGAAILAAHGGG